MHFVEMHGAPVLFFTIVAVTYVYNIVVHIFFHHIPRAATQSESLPLSYGVEPVSVVFAEFTPCFYFHNRASFFSEVAADEVVVVDFSQEAYPLLSLR